MDPTLIDPSYSNPSFDVANSIAMPFFALLSSLALILPFRAFVMLRNFPAGNMVVVLWIINFSTLTSAIIWHSEDWTTWWKGPIWCDVTSILRWPITLAMTTSVVCFIRGLANALDTDAAIMNPTKSQRRRNLVTEIAIIWTVPVMEMGCHYIIQANRYAILPIFGCTDYYDYSWPYIVIVVIWAPIFTLVACYYSALLLYRLKKHRQTISSALSSTGSGMNSRKFIKLAFVGFLILLVYLPTQVIFLLRAIPSSMNSYDWDAVHDPATWNEPIFGHTQDAPYIQYNGWPAVAYALCLAPFYTFNDDAIRAYRRFLVTLGLAKFWPSLKEPFRPNRSNVSSDGSADWNVPERASRRYDPVSLVARYFDGASTKRNGSLSTGTTLGNNSATSGRNNSVSTSLTSQKSLLHANTTPPEPSKHTNFATIRNLNPFLFFSSPSSSTRTGTSSHIGTNTSISTTVGDNEKPFTNLQHAKDLEANNISTSIWSASSSSSPTNDLEIQACSPALSVDPLSPPLGSRAYRERERREMEREKAEKSMPVVVVENPLSVVVTKRVERKEEKL